MIFSKFATQEPFKLNSLCEAAFDYYFHDLPVKLLLIEGVVYYMKHSNIWREIAYVEVSPREAYINYESNCFSEDADTYILEDNWSIWDTVHHIVNTFLEEYQDIPKSKKDTYHCYACPALIDREKIVDLDDKYACVRCSWFFQKLFRREAQACAPAFMVPLLPLIAEFL